MASLADIQKLRKLTGAGMMDCKKALEEAGDNIDAAVEIVRAKGQAIAAKRSDRQASEGCVLCKAENGFGAMIALKCETDFVATNADFIKLAQDILDAAFAAKAKTLEEVNALKIGDQTIAEAVTERSGITGEKMELDGYNTIEGADIICYNHQGKNMLCTMVALNEAAPEVGKLIAMQIAAMNPIAIDKDSVPQAIKDEELKVAIEKTKEEQVSKAVENALKKAGLNPAHFDSEDHMESNKGKGWITDEDIVKAKEIMATTAAEKAANLNENMIQNIAQGRLNKFLKESCLVEQEYCMDGSKTVAEIMKEASATLAVTAFKRFTLRAD